MAKIYRAWVGDPEGGGGHASKLDGTIVALAQKPPESEFVDKPEGAPAGDFIETPGGEFSPVIRKRGKTRPAGTGTVRTEFLGEVLDRRSEVEKAAAARLGARMGAKGKLDKQGLRLGYTPGQERKRSALREARSKLEAEFSEGRHTPEQMLQFEEQMFLQEQAILPQMIRQPPTPQERLQGSIVKLPNGRVGQLDKNGMFKGIDSEVSLKDWNAAIKNATEVLSEQGGTFDEKGTRLTLGKPPTSEEIQAYALDSIQNFQQIQGLLTGADDGQRPPPPQPTARPQLRGRPQQAAVAEAVSPAKAKVGLKEFWDSRFKVAQETSGQRVTSTTMAGLGQEYVTEAVNAGLTPEEAVDSFMDLWEAEGKKKGKFAAGAVPNPKHFKNGRRRLEAFASRLRLQFLRAKAEQ